jgi:hypothetical protein
MNIRASLWWVAFKWKNPQSAFAKLKTPPINRALDEGKSLRVHEFS